MDVTYNYMNRWRTVIWTDVFDCEGKIVKISSLHWCIYNQHDDHLPVGLSAQLVKHCLGIAEAMGSNPIPARIFFKIYFCYCLIIVCYCKNSSHIHRCFCIINPGVKFLLFWDLRIRINAPRCSLFVMLNSIFIIHCVSTEDKTDTDEPSSTTEASAMDTS